MRKYVLHSIPIAFLIVSFCWLSACKNEPSVAPSLGETFAGPISLTLREDVAPTSKVVATVKHGDRMEILQTRRRFVKVRTAKGVEGWTDTRQLMSPEQMKQLQDFSAQSTALPSQGSATAFSTLNMHSEPNRLSPSFYQIAEGSSVQVIGHRITPRTPPAAPAPPPGPKMAPVAKRKREKDKKDGAIPPPPKGPPPGVPSNWLEMSKTRALLEVEQKPAAPPKPPEPIVPVHMEDWSLARTKDGKAGWVLSRMLSMSIPDEVAQYAEGHRITSYFALAKIQDGDAEKKHWLWTTISNNAQPYEFDSFRVFIWSAHRHRYETAYIMRNVKGYYPVEVKTGDSPTFSLIMENDDEKKYKYTFAFEVNRARLVQKTLWDPSQEVKKPAPSSATPESPSTKPSTTEKLKNWFKSKKTEK